MVKFSIILPAYNVEKYIPLTLKSIYQQVFKDFEVICIEDCSTDKTLDIIKKYKKFDPRLKLIKNKEHLGPGTSRNIALKKAKGKYIACIDADDIVDKNYLQAAYEKLETEKVSSVWIKPNILWEAEKTITKMNTFPLLRDLPEGRLEITPDNIVNYPAYSWYKFFRKNVINESIKWSDGLLFEDVEFYYRFYTQNKDVYVIDKPLYLYRRHSSSIMGKSISDPEYQRNLFKVTENIYSFIKEKDLFEKYKEAFLKLVMQNIKEFAGYEVLRTEYNKTVLQTLKNIHFPEEYSDLAKELPVSLC